MGFPPAFDLQSIKPAGSNQTINQRAFSDGAHNHRFMGKVLICLHLWQAACDPVNIVPQVHQCPFDSGIFLPVCVNVGYHTVKHQPKIAGLVIVGHKSHCRTPFSSLRQLPALNLSVNPDPRSVPGKRNCALSQLWIPRQLW